MTIGNVTLTHRIPTTFLKNELFAFRGFIKIPNPSGTKVTIIFTRITDQKKLSFSQYLQPNTVKFNVIANLNLTGTYYLSIFAGTSGITSTKQYDIAPSFIGRITAASPNPIPEASLDLNGNDLVLTWTNPPNANPALTQIIFSQEGGQLLTFLLSNAETTFKVPYEHFFLFSAGPTTIQISQALSDSESAISRTSNFSAPYYILFNAAEHLYDEITSENTFNPIPFAVDVGKTITISGPAGVNLQNEVVLLTPSKKFESYYLSPANANNSKYVFPANAQANLTIPFKETGVYILEINNEGGQAIVNMPVYVGDIKPLLPDFVDLAPKILDLNALNQPGLLNDRKGLVLSLINSVRKKFGADAVYEDPALSSLAQSYSSIQIQQNFVGHIDKQGNSPNKRAELAGIFEGVGENLAVNNNLTQAQLMLERSPVHLRNMVNPRWTRVGLGIVQNSNSIYYLTQEFSSRDMALYPLTADELAQISTGLVSYILKQYPYLKGEDKRLSGNLRNYQAMAQRPYIISYLQGLGYRNVGVSNVQVSYNNGEYMALLQQGNNFEPSKPNYTQLGITVAYDSGMLEIFTAYT